MKVKKILIGIGIGLAIVEIILFAILLKISDAAQFVAWASTIIGGLAGMGTLITAALGSN